MRTQFKNKYTNRPNKTLKVINLKNIALKNILKEF